MKLIPHRLTGCRHDGILSLSHFGTALAARSETVLYPHHGFHNRCASTHFGENQLAPGSIGISPLTTAHPLIFQH
jgi:hypothetical protein